MSKNPFHVAVFLPYLVDDKVEKEKQLLNLKLLIQHRHYNNEISGVLTYINSVIPELEAKSIKIKTISTRQDNFQKWLSYVFWADIVHMNSNDLLFALLCKILGKKIIIKYHYTFYHSIHSYYEPMKFTQRLREEFKRTLPKANYPLKWKLYTVVKWAKLLTRLTTTLLANSHIACSNFLGESCAFPWSVSTLYNPIKIQPHKISKTLENLSKPYKFIFVGRLDADKGVDILLRAVQILQNENKEFQVALIGDGGQAQELKQLASKLGILKSVSFLGKLPNQEALLEVQSAVALIAPSRWQDPAPYVVLEASSVQTSSIVSKMGGLPEVAGPFNWFFDNEDANGLANCMRECLENPVEALHRGLLSSQYVAEHFSPRGAAEKLLDICDKLCPKV
ncbi:glycosyltransferase family 4 protein [Scytonema hofmannii]|uniref:glycosyltransferase family 4 protein n=1 Tax=Scytonema hofmannii TaxID=34078 RepID=UPI00037E7FE5|nr:glycosyltransferase [Scytonema hofmannii]